MIKTIETRDGEVSSLPGPFTGGGHGVCLGSCQPGAFCQLCLFESLSEGRGGPAVLEWGLGGWPWLHSPANTGLDCLSLPPQVVSEATQQQHEVL